jgi:hypothetical protein
MASNKKQSKGKVIATKSKPSFWLPLSYMLLSLGPMRLDGSFIWVYSNLHACMPKETKMVYLEEKAKGPGGSEKGKQET